MRIWALLWLSVCLTLFQGCSVASPEDEGAICANEPAVEAATVSEALSSIDCSESKDTGYDKGSSFAITVVTVDGKKVETQTANAYYVMAQAAAKAGVTLKVVSGFRTMSQQQYLYSCYVNCSCNNCNLAAKPGYSNHQSGHALDLNASAPGVYNWLANNAGKFGFKRTVPSENWHWEWWSGGPGGGPCGKKNYQGESLGLEGQSYPIVSQGAVEVEVGETVTGWIKLKNVGTKTWKSGTVWLAPIPRDKASQWQSPSWKSAQRISTVDADVAPGKVGQFALDLTGSKEGEAVLKLGWVAEGQAWFADDGGPDDGYFAVKVKTVPSTKPSATGGAGGEAGDSSGSGGSGNGSGRPELTGGAAGDGGNGGGPGGDPELRNMGAGDAPEDAEGGCSIASSTGKRSGTLGWWLALGLFGLWSRRRSA